MTATFGLIMGFFVGFSVGLSLITRMSKGAKPQELLQDKDRKIMLGLIGWGCAVLGAVLGWMAGHYIAYLLR